MAAPGNVLIQHRFHEDERTSGRARGASGLLVEDDWILTHGVALQPVVDGNDEAANFLRMLRPGVVAIAPRWLRETLGFRVFRDASRRTNHQVMMEEHEGNVAAMWKCPLLKRTFDDLFVGWKFAEFPEFNRSLLHVFLLIRLNDANDDEPEVALVERVLARFREKISEKSTRGTNLQIESTPFGNPVFIDSIARGVVSNVLGDDGCVLMTDANTFPGCEGAPVYIVKDCGLRVVCGMVIAPLSWCRGEWVDYTFVANLAPCLDRILRKNPQDYSLPLNSVTDLLDRCVVLVRCGSRWGTATLLDEESGTFLTCSHVVAEAPGSAIKIATRRGAVESSTWARLVYGTADGEPYDVAVIRINPKDVDRSLRAVRLADDTAVRGEAVVSAGFPFFSFARPTISGGNVSKSLRCMLQTTCCVQSGASGGPIVSRTTGAMLGMIVCNAISADGSTIYPRLGMAVPACVLRPPLQEYLRTGDAKVLQALRSNDAAVRNTWKLSGLLPSKI